MLTLAALLWPSVVLADVPFDDGTPVTDAGYVRTAVGDLDGDGDLDFVGASPTTDAIEVGLQQSDGTFAVTAAAALESPTQVRLADVDRDGDLDIVTAASDTDGPVVWLRNDGAGGTWTSTTLTTVDATSDLVCVDMDRDGDLDVVVLDDYNSGVRLLENTDGAGGAWADATIGSVPYPSALAAGDFNADGRTDVVVANTFDRDVLLLTQGADGDFALSTIHANSNYATALEAADVDADGDLDLVATLSAVNDVVWFRNDGGTWTRYTIDTNLPGADGLAVVDLDQDGDLDVVTGSTGSNGVWYENREGKGTLWLGFGFGASSTSGVAVGDFDGDGDPDVLGGDASTATLFANERLHRSVVGFDVSASATCTDPADTVAADVNGDGIADVVGGCTDGVRVVLGDTFAASTLDTTAASVVAAGDLDGDGDVDVVATGNGLGRWFANQGDGTFASATAIGALTDTAPDALALGDVDRDGDLDLVWVDASVGDVKLGVNDGSMGLTVKTIASEIGATALVFVDIDRNGRLDLVVADRVLTLLINDGTPTTGTWKDVALDHAADAPDLTDVAALDVDGDGDIDVVGLTDDGVVAVYTNSGDSETFTRALLTDGAGAGRSVHATDLDHDGDVDLIAVHADAAIAWLSDDGWTAQTIATGTFGRAALADFDADGDADLFVPDRGDDRWERYMTDLQAVGLAAAEDGTVTGDDVVAFSFTISHLGRPGDATLGIDVLTLYLLGEPELTTLSDVLAAVSLWVDDGDGVFDAATDTLIIEEVAPDLDNDLLSLSPSDPGVGAGASATWFAVFTRAEGFAALNLEIAVGAAELYASSDVGESVDVDPGEGWVVVVLDTEPVADAGGPYTADEAVAFTVDASGSTDAVGTALTAAWDCDDDGIYETIGDTCTIEAPGTWTIGLQVTDDVGLVGVDTTTVTVANVDPTLTVDGPTALSEGETATFTATTSDPGGTAVDVGWAISDVGGSGDTFTFTFYASRTYTISATATDGEGGQTRVEHEVVVANAPPSIDSTPTPTAVEGAPWTYTPVTSDPGYDAVTVSLDGAPAGMTLSDGTIRWTPAWTDAGTVVFDVVATDEDGGVGIQTVTLTVTAIDLDADGLGDAWELEHDVDEADADPDADGRTNLDEYEAGTDPRSYDGPGAVTPVAPIDEDTAATVTFVWEPATAPQGDPLTYDVEVYDAAGLVVEVSTADDAVTVATGIAENDAGTWRVRAADPYVAGPWSALEAFTVDAVAEAPSVPNAASPLDGDAVSSTLPVLAWTASVDPDGDTVTYDVTVVGVSSATGLTDPTWTLDVALVEDAAYTWQVRAVDATGLESGWSDAVAFTVDTTNAAPDAPAWVSPEDTVDGDAPTLVVSAPTDPDDTDLVVVFALDVAASYDTAALIEGTSTDGTWDLDAEGLALTHDTTWYARARVEDARGGASAWVETSFFVRGDNDAPTAPTLLSPADDDVVARDTAVTFEVALSTDPEGDAITYGFAVLDVDGAVVASVDGLTDTTWSTVLEPGSYTWTASATDAYGAAATSEARALTVDAGGCGCATGSPGPALFSLIPVLLVLRRRARQR